MARPASAQQRIDYLTSLCRTVPYHLVEAVLRDPRVESLAPLKLDGTLLFADMVGFTAMCERLAASGPEGLSRLGAILSALFEHLLEDAVFPYGGYLVHFGGDSITAVFHGDDHARRAAAAALAALGMLRADVGRLVAEQGEQLMLRIGLASGELRLPIVGDAARRIVGCAGETAHEALRMQRLAQPNEVALHPSVVAALGACARMAPSDAGPAVLLELEQWPEPRRVEELEERVETDVEAKIALLEPFMPEPLRSRLRSMPAEWRIEGELREPVIAFAEFWGLDEGAGNLPVATELSQAVVRAFRKYGGLVAKGDLADRGHRLLVLFGLLQPSENDVERALLACLEVAARVRSLAVATGVDVGMRAGVHAGRVYFGAIGSTHKYDLTVVGDAVNVAARTAAAAKPYEVLATQSALGPWTDEFDHSPREPILVKGKTEPLELCVVHAHAAGRSHYVRHRTPERKLAARDRELELLAGSVDDAIGGRGRFLGICGKPGTGKSAALAFTLNRAAERGATGIVGRCRYATKAEPLAPILTMFEAFLGIASRDTLEDRAARIAAGLDPFELDRGAPELRALLLRHATVGAAVPDALQPLGESALERAVESVVEFMSKRMASEVMLYAVEDLHFADALTLRLARRLAALPMRGRFLFVATYRPERSVEATRAALPEEVLLLDLPEARLAELVCAELGVEQVAPDLLRFLWQRTFGNPGHAVEVLRFMKERSLLRVQGGMLLAHNRGVAALDEVVPRTLAQVALARLDELGPVERRVLRVASAIGRRFDRAVLEAAASGEVQRDGLEQAVGALEHRGVLTTPTDGRESFMFRDGVTRAVAYGTIPDDERRRLHERIADAMESLVDETGTSAAILALHRERAGQLSLAAQWFERAATLAFQADLLTEALDLAAGFSRVVAEMPDGERPDEVRRARMDWLAIAATARRGLPRETVDRGLGLASSRGGVLEPAEQQWVELWTATALGHQGEIDRAAARLEILFEVTVASDTKADAARELAELERRRGRLELGATWCARARALAEPQTARMARCELACAASKLARGEVAEALSEATAVGARARAAGWPQVLADSLDLLARAELAAGRPREARTAAMEALSLLGGSSSVLAELRLLSVVGQCQLWLGAIDEARRPLERAVALGEEVGAVVVAVGARAHRGAALASSVDPVGGRELLERAAADATRLGLPETAAVARLLSLRLALDRGDRESVASGVRALCDERSVMPWPLHRAERERLLARAATRG